MVLAHQPKESMPIAFAMREAMRHGLGWRAPIFFGVDDEALYTTPTHRIETTPRLSDVLHPFEISAQLLRQPPGADPDRLARTIHQDYCQLRRAQIKAGTSTEPRDGALNQWQDLPYTYRQANRRVADHLPAKLLSAGCYVPSGSLAAESSFMLMPADPGPDVERLARLEHVSWTIERRLDGWTYGPTRNTPRRIHPDLIDYDHLPEETKDYDRNQIHALSGVRLLRIAGQRATKLVRFDLWIGIVGADMLDHQQAAWAAHALRDDILPGLLRSHAHHNITVLSSLTPGGSLLLTEATLELLDEAKRQHRLVAVEGVPAAAAIDAFEIAWNNGAVGYLTAPERGEAQWQDCRTMLAKTIENLEKSPRCERIIELGMAAADGRRAQNAFLVQRAHVLIVAAGAHAPAAPGSPREALAWREDAASMPADLPRYPPRPNKPASGTPRTILLDVSQRNVRSDA